MTVAVPTAEQFAELERRVAELEARAAAESWPEWLSVERAAAYLDVSPERIRKLKDRNRIPHYQEGPGCRVLFKRVDLDAWMETLRRGGDA